MALALNLRLPFYRISEAVEQVTQKRKIDSCIQLRTATSQTLRAKVLIDSPGFGADEQRVATLRIINLVIDLSAMVIVLFDPRHPQPGAIRDIFDHLVTAAISRDDASNFFLVLNQITTAEKEDNAKNFVAAWQDALSKRGLTAGRILTL